MLIPLTASALAWWLWTLLGAGILAVSIVVLYFVVTRRPKPQSRAWKRYSGDSRYL